MALALHAAASLAEAGPAWDPVLADGSVQSSRAWFDSLVEAALPPGARPEFWMVRDGDRPLLLLPMLVGPGRQLGSLTTAYTTAFQPLAASGLDDAALAAAAAAVGRHMRRWPLARLEALDPAWPGLAAFEAGLRRAGVAVRRYGHFGNWRQPVTTWDAYLASRPGALRETIRRKTRAAARGAVPDAAQNAAQNATRTNQVGIEVVTSGSLLGPALAAYEDVYARSWKEPEPAPGLSRVLLPRLAAAGTLRLGVMRAGNQPVAAQYWTVAGGVATVLKLAHDEAFRALSPGTVLTAHMIRYVIEQDGVSELDFGRGDDPYKQLWTGGRHQRIGLLLAVPWRPNGLSALIRHDVGMTLRNGRELATAIGV